MRTYWLGSPLKTHVRVHSLASQKHEVIFYTQELLKEPIQDFLQIYPYTTQH